MIAHGKDIKVITGNSNPALARDICKELGIPLGNSEVGAFSDGENFVSIYETVRGSDVFVVQSTCAFVKDGKTSTVNDSLMELLIIIDALKRASAGRITAVIPYFGYARQDRKTKPRDPISAKLVANLITTAGADRVLTMDLHANQIQGFFDIPVDNMLGSPLFVDYFNRKFKDNRDDTMVDTGGSLCHAAKALVELGGAKDVTACATHGVLSGPAIQRIQDSVLDEVVFLNTIPAKPDVHCDKIRYISVAHLFAEAISHIYMETSVSPLFL